MTTHQGVFVVDENQQLAGIITRADLMRALEQDSSGNMTVLQAGSHKLVVDLSRRSALRRRGADAARQRWSHAGGEPRRPRRHRRIPGPIGNHGGPSTAAGGRARARAGMDAEVATGPDQPVVRKPVWRRDTDGYARDLTISGIVVYLLTHQALSARDGRRMAACLHALDESEIRLASAMRGLRAQSRISICGAGLLRSPS